MNNQSATTAAAPSDPTPKDKLRNIMEAASALTALGDEDSTDGNAEGAQPPAGDKTAPGTASAEDADALAAKRFIPEHKKPDAALTFPEKVCLTRHRTPF